MGLTREVKCVSFNLTFWRPSHALRRSAAPPPSRSVNLSILIILFVGFQPALSQAPPGGNANPVPLPDGGSISFDPNSPPVLIAQGADKDKINVAPGTYTLNTNWTVKTVEVTVTPVAGGPNGGTVVATYVQNLMWGGTAGNQQIASITIGTPAGGASPKGKYDVQAKIIYEKGTGPTYQTVATFSAKVTLEVK